MIPVQTLRSRAALFVALVTVATCSVIAVGGFGCTKLDPGQRDRKINNVPDVVREARSALEFYARGNPLGSESETLDDLVVRVTEVDEARGAKLAAFVAESRRSSAGLAGKAKKALEGF
jgi:hypothetical protein